MLDARNSPSPHTPKEFCGRFVPFLSPFKSLIGEMVPHPGHHFRKPFAFINECFPFFYEVVGVTKTEPLRDLVWDVVMG